MRPLLIVDTENNKLKLEQEKMYADELDNY